MAANNDSIIDLTESCMKIKITDAVIVISDEDTPRKAQTFRTERKSVVSRKRDSTQSVKNRTFAENSRSSSVNLGECAICWEDLGTRRLCSTKCGHVYCLKCLENQLKYKRQCPSCRCQLVGKNSYHPLYIGRND